MRLLIRNESSLALVSATLVLVWLRVCVCVRSGLWSILSSLFALIRFTHLLLIFFFSTRRPCVFSSKVVRMPPLPILWSETFPRLLNQFSVFDVKLFSFFPANSNAFVVIVCRFHTLCHRSQPVHSHTHVCIVCRTVIAILYLFLSREMRWDEM